MSAIASKPMPTAPSVPASAKGPVTPETLVAEALNRLTTIGTLPEVTARIIKTVEDPKSSAGQLHSIVSHDPALVTRVLKVVNSSFYGLPGQIASIERAIVLLGLNGVKNLAVAASLGQLFRGVKLCEPFNAKDLWTHCIAVAVAARDFALHLELPVGDEAFLAGMIHDVGLLAHLQLWPEKLRLVCEEAKKRPPGGGESFCDIETRIIGLNHQQLGRGLAQRWRFPQSCQQVAGSHHNPGTGSDNCLLVNLVHIADTVVCDMNQGFNLTAQGQKIDDMELKAVNLDRAVYEQVAAQLPERITQSLAVFG